LRPSVGEYIQFIKQTASVQHLVRRRFYVVLSWKGVDTRSRPRRQGEVLWQEAEQELGRRSAILRQGLRKLGVRLRDLSQEECFQFLYAGLHANHQAKGGMQWAWR
ncbi:MAG: type VI secretion protein, partial [Firmicutes bacterium]|nr:type VI secretion protein [Bacillota bacterium]